MQDVPPIQFYAVYDGHGGLDASNYASKHLHLNFAKQEDMTENVLEALKKSIKQTDDDFCAKAKNEVRYVIVVCFAWTHRLKILETCINVLSEPCKLLVSTFFLYVLAGLPNLAFIF